MIKRFLLILLALLLLLVAALAVNTLRQGSRQLAPPPLAPLAVDKDAAALRLAEAVRTRTIASATDALQNADQFEQLHRMLETRYPKAHATLRRERVNGLSLLYTWEGTEPKARPILLLAHQDVVPISPGTQTLWKVDPFAGTIRDGFVWGRGAWDDKGNLIAEMEAVEMLVASGFRPQRTVYLAFGADEEVAGYRGARQIAALLQQRGVRLEFVLDEGLLILDGVLPGLSKPAAVIGMAEKGFVSAKLTITATPGHSSMPPVKGGSAIGLMSQVLAKVDKEPFPAAIQGITQDMFAVVVPEMSLAMRIPISNLWLFEPIVRRQLEGASSTNALLRTTTALTVLNAGNAENVLPGQAEAIINYRLLPGDTIAAVLARLRAQAESIVPADRVTVSALPGATEASPVSALSGAPYRLMSRTLREVFPDAIVAPGLMVAGTDAHHYQALSDSVFRFSPVRARSEDLALFHGIDERLSIDNFADMIRFYHRLIGEGSRSSISAP